MPILLATVLLDPPTALLFGAVLALASSRLIVAAPGREVGRNAVIGAAWGALYGLTVGGMYFLFPDWMFAYLKDARELALVPSYVLFVAVLALHGAFGALAGTALVAFGRLGWAWALAFGAFFIVLTVFWVQWRQYIAIGTYEEFLAGKAIPALERRDAIVPLNVPAVVAGGAAIATFAWRLVQGRRLAARG